MDGVGSISMPLTSTKNPRLQTIRRAAASGRPTEDGLLIIEGPHLLDEVLRSGWEVQEVFVTSDAGERYVTLIKRVDAPITELSRRAMESIASTETTQEILALVRPRKWSWDDLLGKTPLILALDGIQDPGNAGTMVRSAEAFGASGVVFLKGSVRSSNVKLIRATAGSIFRLPFLEGVEGTELLRRSQDIGLPVYALAPGGKTNIQGIELQKGCILIVGSEGAGISAELLAASKPVTIPTRTVESLNAAVACSIALYVLHQRRAPA